MSDTPKVEFANEAKRFRKMELAWPLTVDGKSYTSVTARRLSGAEVQAYIESIKADAASVAPPMLDIPFDVYEALDDDDRMMVDEAISDFLPRRLRSALEQTPASGAPTSASSPTS
jgi:hypothetical protein